MLGSEILPIPPPAPAISQLHIAVFETNKTELFTTCHGFLWKVLQPQLSLETPHIAYFIFFNDFIHIYLVTNLFIHMMLLFFFLNCKEYFVSLFQFGNELYNLVPYLDAFAQTAFVVPTIRTHFNSNIITYHIPTHSIQCSGRDIEASVERT